MSAMTPGPLPTIAVEPIPGTSTTMVPTSPMLVSPLQEEANEVYNRPQSPPNPDPDTLPSTQTVEPTPGPSTAERSPQPSTSTAAMAPGPLPTIAVEPVPGTSVAVEETTILGPRESIRSPVVTDNSPRPATQFVAPPGEDEPFDVDQLLDLIDTLDQRHLIGLSR
ncbi:Hypothetical protein FKW44_019518 [Caligus rogercresseyi]|uniref:Uncharacterized protein n=1 Tax=Caligus rogercresseyi TaxID=217165 RepID=A0A7T8GW68_CALRO|nr:Hypothetical protein FKW44_019518 [Caligus rogercresseyi]